MKKADIKKKDIKTLGAIGLGVFLTESKVSTPMGMRAGGSVVGLECTEGSRKRYVLLSADEAKALAAAVTELLTKCGKEV